MLDAYIFESIEQAQQITDSWLIEYNEERPHDALGRMPPLKRKPSPESPASNCQLNGEAYDPKWLSAQAGCVENRASHHPQIGDSCGESDNCTTTSYTKQTQNWGAVCAFCLLSFTTSEFPDEK